MAVTIRIDGGFILTRLSFRLNQDDSLVNNGFVGDFFVDNLIIDRTSLWLCLVNYL